MNKYPKSRNGYNHLYNQEEEGLGKYDIHYINAYKRSDALNKSHKYINMLRYAA